MDRDCPWEYVACLWRATTDDDDCESDSYDGHRVADEHRDVWGLLGRVCVVEQ